MALDAYLGRLREVRSWVASARSAATSQRPALLAQGAAVLRRTDALRLADGSTLPIDDSALASRLGLTDDGAIATALADLDLRIASADRAARSRLPGAVVDDRLRAVLGARPAAAKSEPSLIDVFLALVARAFAFVGRGTFSVVDPYVIVAAITGVGIAIALLILGILGRGARERIRREALSRDVRVGATDDPIVHLRRADAAIAAGQARDALHELYLFALTSLALHETIRFDPALTDRELLARAAAIPQIGALRSLVALHERVWFGLKPAGGDDAARARELAERVAA